MKGCESIIVCTVCEVDKVSVHCFEAEVDPNKRKTWKNIEKVSGRKRTRD